MFKLSSEEKFVENNFGYCCYTFDIINSFMDYKIYGIIYNLYIYPQFRKLGNGRNLLLECIDIIRKMDYEDEIIIEASPMENSISVENLILFYKSMGLKIL